MRISVQSSVIFNRFSPDEGFARMREWGFEAVDFGITRWCPSNDIRSNAAHLPLEADLDEILSWAAPFRDAAQKNGVAFAQTHAPFPVWMPDAPGLHERMTEITKKAIAVSGYLGAPYCVVHPVFHPVTALRHTAEEEWALNRAFYTSLIPALRESGVVCCLENMFTNGGEGRRVGSACSEFPVAAEWIDRLNDIAGEELFGFCFDAGHCHLTNQNMRRAVNVMGQRIKALHIHDNDGHTDWHMAPYMGTADWESFLQGLRDIGYDHDINFETFHVPQKYPEALMDCAMRSIAQTGDYFRSCLK